MESSVMKAIMSRYGGLTGMYDAMREDVDTVIVNLESDVNNEFDSNEILLMIEKI
jgi:hypothetical protein